MNPMVLSYRRMELRAHRRRLCRFLAGSKTACFVAGVFEKW